MTEDRQLDELDRLSTEELRQRAFQRAEERHDMRFFWDLFRHLPSADDAEELDVSTGSYGAALTDAAQLWEQWTQHEYGQQEPIIRAAFIDYLLKHED